MKKKRTKITDISVMIAGIAGDGVLFTGNILAKILKRQGWWVFTYRDFPSNIRGEPTNYTIRASLDRVQSRADDINVFMAFDCGAIIDHADKMAEGGLLLCDGIGLSRSTPAQKKKRTYHIYMDERAYYGELVLPEKGHPLVANDLGLDVKRFERILEEFQ